LDDPDNEIHPKVQHNNEARKNNSDPNNIGGFGVCSTKDIMLQLARLESVCLSQYGGVQISRYCNSFEDPVGQAGSGDSVE
jgi:hypothetical protein